MVTLSRSSQLSLDRQYKETSNGASLRISNSNINGSKCSISLSFRRNKCGAADGAKSRKKQTHHGRIESEHGEGKERVQDAQKDPHAARLRAATFLPGSSVLSFYFLFFPRGAAASRRLCCCCFFFYDRGTAESAR